MSVRYIFDLFADIRYSWVLRFLPENQCAERERGHFEFSTMFILYLCTQLGNEFLVTFYTPRNSNASEVSISKYKFSISKVTTDSLTGIRNDAV